MIPPDSTDAYAQAYQRLLAALQVSHDEQQALLHATDAAFALLGEDDESLSDEQYLGLKVLLGEAQNRLGRYFGM